MLLRVLLFYCLAFAAAEYLIDCPLPKCKSCILRTVREAPGVGFELSFSHGLAAVRYYNGSAKDLVQVPGAADYRSLMHRRSTPESSSSLLRVFSGWRDTYDRYRRRLNKLLGRPATPDVGVLAAMLHDLKAAAESQLPAPLDQVVVAAPLLPGLPKEDLHDAIEYAGLRSWLTYGYPFPERLSSSHTAFAANGYGLCHDVVNTYSCEADLYELPYHRLLSVTFTPSVLYITMTVVQDAFHYFREDAHIVDYSAGLDALPSYPSADAYWAHVQSQIAALPRAAEKPITALILQGEAAWEGHFRIALRDALAELGQPVNGIRPQHSLRPPWMPENETDVADPVFAAARGAALYARWRQEVDPRCEERDLCEGKRRTGPELPRGSGPKEPEGQRSEGPGHNELK